MSVEQRLETLETDLEVVKQLLASTASYGESAQRRLDQQTANQDRLDRRLDEFIFQAQRLINEDREKTTRLEGAFERIEAIAAYVTRKVDNHDAQMQAQAEQLAELRRISANHDAQLNELRAGVARLDRLMDFVIRGEQPE